MHQVYEWKRMTLMQNLTCLNISLPSEAFLYATMPIMSAQSTWCRTWSWIAICKKEMWSLSIKVIFCFSGRMIISGVEYQLNLNPQNRLGIFFSIWHKTGSTELHTGYRVRGRPRGCWEENFEVGTDVKLPDVWRQAENNDGNLIALGNFFWMLNKNKGTKVEV